MTSMGRTLYTMCGGCHTDMFSVQAKTSGVLDAHLDLGIVMAHVSQTPLPANGGPLC